MCTRTPESRCQVTIPLLAWDRRRTPLKSAKTGTGIVGSKVARPRFGALVCGLSVVLALSGCSGGDTLSDTRQVEARQTDQSTSEPTPEPTDEPSRDAFVLPDCGQMNSVAQQEYEDYGPEMFSEPAGETDAATFDRLADPVAQEVMAQASQHAGCRWPVHMEGTVVQYVAELEPADQKQLITSLRDAVTPEKHWGEALVFTTELPPENERASATQATHVFLGNAWAVIFDVAGQRAWGYAESAIDGLLAANPSLADPPRTASPSDGDCSTLTGEEALARWAPEIPPPVEGVTDYWDLTGQFSDVSGYDPCADLSWIVLRETPCCTRFSPSPVLLFHRGEFVQVATEPAYALSSNSETPVERISDQTLVIFFMWQGDDIAGLAEIASSNFTWNESTDSITRTGDLPPN